MKKALYFAYFQGMDSGGQPLSHIASGVKRALTLDPRQRVSHIASCVNGALTLD
jgi:hypothetical protein